jgi:hypothetical protein
VTSKLMRSVFVSLFAVGAPSLAQTNAFTPNATSNVLSPGVLPGTACPTGQSVSGISTSGVPTCAVPDGSIGDTPVAAAPTATPAPGTYTGTQNVVLTSSTPGYVIHYSTSGTTTSSSPIYSAAIAVATAEIISAVTCATNYICSPASTLAYTIDAPGSAEPRFPAPRFPVPLSAVSLGQNANLNGFRPFPGSAIYSDISAYALDTPTDANFRSTWGNHGLHADGGASPLAGIGYYVVDEGVTSDLLHIPTKCSTADQHAGGDKIPSAAFCPESDDVPMPITADMRQEGNTQPLTCWTAGGDHHLVVLERSRGVLYESYQMKTCNGVAVTYALKTWDVNKPLEAGQNSFARTSADAAGLSIFMGALGVRYEEIAAGHIDHAMRMTLQVMNCAFYSNGDGHALVALPATHGSNCGGGSYSSYYGMRFRLNPSFDISRYSATNKVILTAAKKYGFIIADIGADAYFQLAPDPRWNDDDLALLDAVKLSDFQVVNTGTKYGVDLPTEDKTNGIISLYDQTGITSASTVGKAVKPRLPQPGITSFTASASSVPVGQPVTFTGIATDSGEAYVENAGVLINNTVTIIPDKTRTYSMVALGLGGYKHSADLTIKVTGTQVSKPVPSVASGTYATPQTISLSSTGAIHYTLDGTLATCYSPLYSNSLTLGTLATAQSTSETINLQAIACTNGQITSDVLNSTYIIKQTASGLTVVQKMGIAVNSSTATVTLEHPPTAGNMLLIAVSYFQSVTVPSGWTAISKTGNRTGAQLAIYKTSNLGTGTYTVTSAGGQEAFTVYEIQGATSALIDTYADTPQSPSLQRDRTTQIYTTAAATPKVVGDLAIAAIAPMYEFSENPISGVTAGWSYDIYGSVPYHSLITAVRSSYTTDVTTPTSAAFTLPSSVGQGNDTPTLGVTILIRQR